MRFTRAFKLERSKNEKVLYRVVYWDTYNIEHKCEEYLNESLTFCKKKVKDALNLVVSKPKQKTNVQVANLGMGGVSRLIRLFFVSKCRNRCILSTYLLRS